MVFKLYTVYDKVAQHYGPIFQAVNSGVAMRNFRNLLKEVTPIDRDAYVLREVGEFDDETAIIDSENPTDVMVEDDTHEIV